MNNGQTKNKTCIVASLVFYIEMNTSNTFYSSINETKGLLASLTTIPESLHPIRNPINTRPIS